MRRLTAVTAAAVAALLALTAAPALGGYTAKIANSTDTVGSAPYFVCSDALGQDKAAALFQWPLSDLAASTSVADISGKGNAGAYQGTRAVDTTTPLACPRDGGRAWSLDGTSSYADFATSQANPTAFTIEVWFRTTTPTGRLIGFGSAATGASGSYDRHLYLTKTGTVAFGVYPGSIKTITSTATVADGAWHQAAATLSSAGMVLYVDGAKVASDTTVTTAQNYTGYWRVGYDSLSGWPNTGTSNWFKGGLRYAAVYTSALSASQIATHWGAGSGT